MWISPRRSSSMCFSHKLIQPHWHLGIWQTLSSKEINIASVHAFPGNPTNDLCIVSAMLYCLSYMNAECNTMQGNNRPTPPVPRRSQSRMSSLHLIWGWWRPTRHSKEIPRHRFLLLEPTRWVRTPHCLHDLEPPLERWRSLSQWCCLNKKTKE